MMKKISIIILAFFAFVVCAETSYAGWMSDIGKKVGSASHSIKEKTVSAYDKSKEYVEENKEGWKEKASEVYDKSKEKTKKYYEKSRDSARDFGKGYKKGLSD